MKYTTVLSKSAIKFLRTLNKKSYEKIVQYILDMETNPLPNGVKMLKGYEKVYRARVGDYRIIYTIDGGKLIISVIDIGHRKNVYNDY